MLPAYREHALSRNGRSSTIYQWVLVVPFSRWSISLGLLSIWEAEKLEWLLRGSCWRRKEGVVHRYVDTENG